MKILCSDFDGTFNYDGIDAVKSDYVKKWRDAGNKIGLVSGRDPGFIQSIQNSYDLQFDFIIAYNGGTIIDCKGNIIYNEICNDVDAKVLIADLFDWGCDFAHLNNEAYLFVRPNCADLRDGEYHLSDISEMSDFRQISVQLKNLTETEKVISLITEKYGDVLCPLQNGICIDIVPPGVNKASGIYKLMDFYNADYKDIVVVGDSYNDIDMIREFKSYAMENGAEEVKRLASFGTKSIIEVIEKEL